MFAGLVFYLWQLLPTFDVLSSFWRFYERKLLMSSIKNSVKWSVDSCCNVLMAFSSFFLFFLPVSLWDLCVSLTETTDHAHWLSRHSVGTKQHLILESEIWRVSSTLRALMSSWVNGNPSGSLKGLLFEVLLMLKLGKQPYKCRALSLLITVSVWTPWFLSI